VLRTNTALPAVEVALKYKHLRMIEQIFRTVKSLLDTRPVFHKTDATICGHVFCSFLALVLRDALLRRMERAKVTAEWADILRDLDALTEVEIENGARRFLVRSRAKGSTVAILRCVGAADHHTTHRRRACKRKGKPRIGLTSNIGHRASCET